MNAGGVEVLNGGLTVELGGVVVDDIGASITTTQAGAPALHVQATHATYASNVANIVVCTASCSSATGADPAVGRCCSDYGL